MGQSNHGPDLNRPGKADMIRVRFYSLRGDFKTVSDIVYPSINDAKNAAQKYATDNGFTNVKFVDDDYNDYEIDIRVTATTPNGRAGRNIARIEPGD